MEMIAQGRIFRKVNAMKRRVPKTEPRTVRLFLHDEERLDALCKQTKIGQSEMIPILLHSSLNALENEGSIFIVPLQLKLDHESIYKSRVIATSSPSLMMNDAPANSAPANLDQAREEISGVVAAAAAAKKKAPK